MKRIFLVLFLFCSVAAHSQSVGIGTTTPNSSAALDVSSTNKGLLIPRLTTLNRTNITNPVAGLIVYDTDTKSVWLHNGTSWQTMGGSNARSIFIPASAMSYSGSGVTTSSWGLNLTNIAGAIPGFILPKPVDWDSSKAFTITLHYSIPNIDASTIVSWRLRAGSTNLNATTGNANTGWDSYDYSQSSDATPSSIPASSAYTNVAKTQTWTATYSSQFNTWYVGTNVSTNNDFSNDPIWHFRFQRGFAANNGEGYTGILTINGASINYTAK